MSARNYRRVIVTQKVVSFFACNGQSARPACRVLYEGHVEFGKVMAIAYRWEQMKIENRDVLKRAVRKAELRSK